MKRRLRIILEVDVIPLSCEDMAEVNQLLDYDEDPLTGEQAVKEVNATELGDAITGLFHEDAISEALAGSNLFVTFDPKSVTISDSQFIE